MNQPVVTLHVLAAAVWTGGHLVLALTVLPRALRASDPEILHAFESGYERVGIPALLIQIITGFMLAWDRLPDPAAWLSFDTALGSHIGLKLIFLVATLALAMHARLRVLPDLDASRLRALAWHIVPVTVISVLMLLVGVGVRFVA